MNPFQALGVLSAVMLLLPLTRRWSVQQTRHLVRRFVAATQPATVRRWAAGPRLGRFTFAYWHGVAWGAGTLASAFFAAHFAFSMPGVIATICAGFYGADWGAQLWSEREAKIRELATDAPPLDLPLSVLPPTGEEPQTITAPLGLFTGLGILGAVFAFILALATYRDNLKAPETSHLTAESSPIAAATVPKLVERAPLEIPPPVIGAETLPSPAAKQTLAPSYQNVDFNAVIQQMNDEANNLMPYALPLPIPDDQYQDLAGKFQKLATKYFPDLAVRDSQLNREFVVRYKQRQTDTPTFFDQPDWPVRLTIECVDLLTEGKTTPVEPPAMTE